MKIFLSVLLGLVLSLNTFAQSNFVPFATDNDGLYYSINVNTISRKQTMVAFTASSGVDARKGAINKIKFYGLVANCNTYEYVVAHSSQVVNNKAEFEINIEPNVLIAEKDTINYLGIEFACKYKTAKLKDLVAK